MLIAAIAEGKPAQHLEQLPGGRHRIPDPDRIGAMHGLVAEILEQSEAAHLLTGQVAEDPRIHQIRQRLGGAWPLQLGIVVVDPLHQQLDRAAGVEAGGAGIGEGKLLDLKRLFMQLRPLASNQGVLGVHRPEDCAITNANQSGSIAPRLQAAPGYQP